MRVVNRLSRGHERGNVKEYGSMEVGSKRVCKAAVRMAMSETREEENEVKAELLDMGRVQASAAA